MQTLETKLKIAKTLKEKYANKQLVPNMSGAHSTESRKKQSKTKLGKPLTPEHKQKISIGVNNSEEFQKSFTEEKKEKTRKTVFKKYGVNCVFQNKDIKARIAKTNIEKYGNISPANGTEQIKKKKETWTQTLGVENPFQSEKIKKEIKDVCLKKYGVEYPMQNKEIFEKSQKNSFNSKKYKDTNINYRASYELDFLEHFYNKYPDIQNGPSIKYNLLNGKNKVYHPDFYIPSLNLIIECKNSWLMKRDKEGIQAKEKATIDNGFNYIIVVDKNYPIFI